MGERRGINTATWQLRGIQGNTQLGCGGGCNQAHVTKYSIERSHLPPSETRDPSSGHHFTRNAQMRVRRACRHHSVSVRIIISAGMVVLMSPLPKPGRTSASTKVKILFKEAQMKKHLGNTRDSSPDPWCARTPIKKYQRG